jgi:acyl-CoA reductase-like NAD-dependent aldehyde dehydrogenase
MTATRSPATDAGEHAAAARAAQPGWAALTVRRRLATVRRLRHLLAAECDALCAAVARDIAKPAEETLAGELLPLAAACRFLEREAARLLRPRRVPRSVRPLWLWGQSDTVHRRPRGVVGVIGTWNYPLFLNGAQLLQALTAGNAVVWKPSEVAPASAAALRGLFERVGFSDGLVRVMGADREGGPALVEADIDHLVFTGSAETGRRVARCLGERLVSSTLELSGCDALFVLAGANVALAARAAWFGVTLNRGQTCVAVRRAFVHRPLYPAFCEHVRALAAPAAPVRLALAALAVQAERLVREALAEGARLACEPPPTDPAGAAGLFLPTAVLDARPDMALCREASFAPLLAVLPFDTPEEALRMDALCPFALGASVFAADPRRAEAFAARLRAETVAVNDVIAPTAHPATPFGGRGASGWGVTQGAEGLLEMTVPQAVSVRAGTLRPHYNLAGGRGAPGQVELLRGLLEAGHAPTAGARWRGWRRLLRALRSGAWRGAP